MNFSRFLRWLLLVLLLLILILYGLYRYNPRQFGQPFVILAHIVQDPANHPNCIPPVRGDSSTPDYHDSWASPSSKHKKQHYEWLGDCATEENQPLQADRYDDGLRAVTFSSGGEWRRGGKFTMKILVATTHSFHTREFPTWGKIAV